MLQFNSALLALAADFTGKVAPFQAIRIEPAPTGGVMVASTNKGHIAFIGHDPSGQVDEARTIIPSGDLINACRGIRTAERYLAIDGTAGVVTTVRKSATSSVQAPLMDSLAPFPPLREVMAEVIRRWSATPAASPTAGRYDAELLKRAIKAAGAANADAIVLSAFDGGPLRIQLENLEALVLVMPQTAQPIPPIPQWAVAYAQENPSG